MSGPYVNVKGRHHRILSPREDRLLVDADDHPDGKVGVDQGRTIQRVRRDTVFLPALAEQDDGVLLLRGVFPDEARKLELGFEDFVGAPVERELFLPIEVLEPGQLPVRFMDLGGNVFPRHRNLPDETAEFFLHAGYPHLAPQIDDKSGVIRYPFTHCPFPP
jgi:hypothetical protein